MLAEFDFQVLVHVDALLNSLAFVFLCASLVAIKRGNVELHKKLIFVAVGFSLFVLLLAYLGLRYTPW